MIHSRSYLYRELRLEQPGEKKIRRDRPPKRDEARPKEKEKSDPKYIMTAKEIRIYLPYDMAPSCSAAAVAAPIPHSLVDGMVVLFFNLQACC